MLRIFYSYQAFGLGLIGVKVSNNLENKWTHPTITWISQWVKDFKPLFSVSPLFSFKHIPVSSAYNNFSLNSFYICFSDEMNKSFEFFMFFLTGIETWASCGYDEFTFQMIRGSASNWFLFWKRDEWLWGRSAWSNI